MFEVSFLYNKEALIKNCKYTNYPEIDYTVNCIRDNYDSCMKHGTTFNYCLPNDNVFSVVATGHYFFDMMPYYWWLNCRDVKGDIKLCQ